MTIKRFSLYRDFNNWDGDIYEDTAGRWCKWRDVVGYIDYALANGYNPPPTEIEPPRYVDYMAESHVTRFDNVEDEQTTLPLDEGEDVYDLIVGEVDRHREDD